VLVDSDSRRRVRDHRVPQRGRSLRARGIGQGRRGGRRARGGPDRCAAIAAISCSKRSCTSPARVAAC
jgi:hypothetical protein